MKIEKIIITDKHEEESCGPDKAEIIESVKHAMIHIGISKSLWIEDLGLPEADFDAILKKAADDAEHVAKGDKKGIELAVQYACDNSLELSKMIEALKEEEDEDDADDNEED
jgi:uncharacterized damage-inducible protein DinB